MRLRSAFFASSRQRFQRHCILRCVGGLIIVEIDVDRLYLPAPVRDALSPLLQLCVCVAALVWPFWSMQPNVSPIGRDFDWCVAAGQFENAKCRVALMQYLVNSCCMPARLAEFERVPMVFRQRR